MLYNKILNHVEDIELTSKITGMLIDFEVLELMEILNSIESERELLEKIREAKEVIFNAENE